MNRHQMWFVVQIKKGQGQLDDISEIHTVQDYKGSNNDTQADLKLHLLCTFWAFYKLYQIHSIYILPGWLEKQCNVTINKFYCIIN